MLLTVGERITMALLSMAIQALGVDAISFTGSQCGIITNASHNRARIIEVRPFRVLDELEAGKIVIVAGYQGVSYKREITTLGRGGSDTTAVALAAALNAERCEIYSDVAAVRTADPKVVLGAAQLEEVTYDTMIDLARYGAKVLNADAVEFARRAGIAIYTRSTFSPDEAGTIVRANLPGTGRPVAGVTGRKDVIGVEVWPGEGGAIPAISDMLGEGELVPDFVCGGPAPGTPVLFVFSATANVGLDGKLDEALARLDGHARILPDLGTVTVVGEVVASDDVRRDWVECLCGLAQVKGIIATPTAVTVVVPSGMVDETVRMLHKACVGA
jgi:aspartate kinase